MTNKQKMLHAWKPWEEVLKAYRYLASLKSPGDFEFFDIFWIGSTGLLSTVRDVLDRVDKFQTKTHARIADDFLKEIGKNKKHHPIFWEFICKERNSLLHEFSTEAKRHRVTTCSWCDGNLSFEELVKKYGEQKCIVWGEEMEDGLELLEKALEWWEMNLRVFDQAVVEQERFPFSSGYNRWHELANASFKRIQHFDYSWARGAVEPISLPYGKDKNR